MSRSVEIPDPIIEVDIDTEYKHDIGVTVFIASIQIARIDILKRTYDDNYTSAGGTMRPGYVSDEEEAKEKVIEAFGAKMQEIFREAGEEV